MLSITEISDRINANIYDNYDFKWEKHIKL